MPTPSAVPAPFIRAHTTLTRPPAVPEVQLHVAGDVVAVWEAMETEGGGAGAAVASDVDPYSRAAIPLNAEVNAVGPIEVVGDVLAGGPPDVDVVLAGDVCYDRGMTERVLPWLWTAWVAGRTVLLGDPGRRYLPGEGLVAVAEYDVPEVDEDRVRRTTVWRLP